MFGLNPYGNNTESTGIFNDKGLEVGKCIEPVLDFNEEKRHDLSALLKEIGVL
jgi:hypothetical protein